MDIIPKALAANKNEQVNCLKFQTLCTAKEAVSKGKGGLQMREYLQAIYLIKAYSPKYVKPFHHAVLENPTAQLEDGLGTRVDLLLTAF